MNEEEKKTYRRLQRQVGEAYKDYVNKGWKGKPNLFNNRLRRMKEFLVTTSGDFTNNRFMKMEYIDKEKQ